MEYATDRLLEISLAKFDRSKTQRKQSSTSSKLHRNLLVSSVLRAIKIDSNSQENCLMDYRESKLIDMELDDVNLEISRQEIWKQKNKNRTYSEYKVQDAHEWKPRVCDGPCREPTIDCETSKISGTEHIHQQSKKTKLLENYDAGMGKKIASNDEQRGNLQTVFSKQEIRNKRPRDSNSDMNHVPKPNKIFKGSDSCDQVASSDTQAVSSLENLFRDSFNELVDRENLDRRDTAIHSLFSLPLVTVMAC